MVTVTVIGRVAQLVEHLTFNQVAPGSSPGTLTINKSGRHHVCRFFVFPQKTDGFPALRASSFPDECSPSPVPLKRRKSRPCNAASPLPYPSFTGRHPPDPDIFPFCGRSEKISFQNISIFNRNDKYNFSFIYRSPD